MRKFLTTATALALLVSLLAGCGGTPANSPAPASSPSSSGAKAADSQQYINAVLLNGTNSSEPSILDVVHFTGILDRTVLWNILEPLTRIQNGELVSAGAKSWDISTDGLTYTFKLRDNSWSDGKKVTAQDYAYAIKQQADPANTFSFASDYFCIKNFQAIFTKKEGAGPLGVEAVDESTLKITLDYPNPALLTTVDFFPLRQDYVEKFGTKLGSDADKLVCCGPFVLTSWVHNTQLDFVKNDKYWDASNVKLQKFTYKIITDTTAQYASLENKSVDFVTLTNSEYVKKFKANTNLNGTFIDLARTQMVVFNTQDALFKNAKVRQAFSLAIDRESVAESLNNGLALPAYALNPASSSVGSQNFRKAVPEPLLELKKANSDPRALLIEGLKELGVNSDPSAHTVSFYMGGTNAVTKTQGEFYQQMWQSKLGVKVSLVFNDNATHSSYLKTGKYQFGFTSWGANIEPQFLMTRWVGGGQAQWKNSEYDATVQKATKALDAKERLNLYAQAEKQLVATEAVIAPVVYAGTMLFSYKYVQGLPTNSFDTTGMKTVYTAGR